VDVLSATVTGNHTDMANGWRGEKNASTGAIGGSTYSGYAGIQTASMNTGISSVNQAATSIAANANVSFGTP
jgi:hypothetical protein